MVDPAPLAMGALQERLGHRFARPELLELALTHRSWCAEHQGFQSNERLEFLGDSVLGMAVTGHIYASQPPLPEGAMAKARAAVVSAAALAEVARKLDLGAGLRLGKGEEATGGRDKTSILADAMEAVLGAIYIDSSPAIAYAVVLDLFGERAAAAVEDPGLFDFKTRLQELAASRFDGLPDYRVSEEGPDHEKCFTATVTLGGVRLGEGIGRSKKEAQQAAARQAWVTLDAQVHTAAEAQSASDVPAERLLGYE